MNSFIRTDELEHKNSMRKVLKNFGIVLFLFLLLHPSIAAANAGIPMIIFTFPVMMLALILIEAMVLKINLKIKYKKSFFLVWQT